MDENLIYVFFGINVMLLVGLVTGMLWWQKKHGRVSPKIFALIITGYFSFAFITTLSPLLANYARTTIIVYIIFLALLWAIQFPFLQWIYKQFISSDTK